MDTHQSEKNQRMRTFLPPEASCIVTAQKFQTADFAYLAVPTHRIYPREDPCIRLEHQCSDDCFRVSLEPCFFASTLAFQTWIFCVHAGVSVAHFLQVITEIFGSNIGSRIEPQLLNSHGKSIISTRDCESRSDLKPYGNHISSQSKQTFHTKFTNCTLEHLTLIDLMGLCDVQDHHLKVTFYSSGSSEPPMDIIFDLDFNNRFYRIAQQQLMDNPVDRGALQTILSLLFWSKGRYPEFLSSHSRIAFTYARLVRPRETFHQIKKYKKSRSILLEEGRAQAVSQADHYAQTAMILAYSALAEHLWHRLCVDPCIALPFQFQFLEGKMLHAADILSELVSFDECPDENCRRELQALIVSQRKIISSSSTLDLMLRDEEEFLIDMTTDSAVNFLLVTDRKPYCCSLCRNNTVCEHEFEFPVLPDYIQRRNTEKMTMGESILSSSSFYFCESCLERIKEIDKDFFDVWKMFETPSQTEAQGVQDSADVIYAFMISLMYKVLMSMLPKSIGNGWCRTRTVLRRLLQTHITKKEARIDVTKICKLELYCFVAKQETVSPKKDGVKRFSVDHPDLFMEGQRYLHVVCHRFHFLLFLNEGEGQWENADCDDCSGRIEPGSVVNLRPCGLEETPKAFQEHWKQVTKM